MTPGAAEGPVIGVDIGGDTTEVVRSGTGAAARVILDGRIHRGRDVLAGEREATGTLPIDWSRVVADGDALA